MGLVKNLFSGPETPDLPTVAETPAPTTTTGSQAGEARARERRRALLTRTSNSSSILAPNVSASVAKPTLGT